jgi:hypothetical protein
MTTKQVQATNQILEHVNRAHDAIIDFRRDGISAEGALMKPVSQAAVESSACRTTKRTAWQFCC